MVSDYGKEQALLSIAVTRRIVAFVMAVSISYALKEERNEVERNSHVISHLNVFLKQFFKFSIQV